MICRTCGFKKALYQTEDGKCNKCTKFLTKPPAEKTPKKRGPKPKLARSVLIM